MAMREDQVKAAVNFLRNPTVAKKEQSEKENFLKNKGLTEEEIATAFKRVQEGDTSSTTPAAPPPATSPAAPAPEQQPPRAAIQQPPPQQPPPQQPTTGYGGGYPPAQPQPQPGYGGYPWGGQPGGPPPPMQYNPIGPGPGAWSPVAPYDPPASSSGPWWAWLLGGLGVGLGATVLASQPWQKVPPGSQPPILPSGGQAVPAQLPALPASSGPALAVPAPSASAPAGEGSESAEAAASVKEQGATEELLTMLRQQSEEARENAAVFAKALQTQQEQYQQLFGEMQKVLQLQAQQQKQPRPPPMELSAATIQSLASLMQPSQPSEPADKAEPGSAQPVSGSGAAASSAGGGGGGNLLRESFDAINHNLLRLVRESPSKGQAEKTLSTLAMVLQNPTRKVNTTSQRFVSFKDGAAAELLKLAGFQYQEPNYTMPQEQTSESLPRVADLIQGAQRNLEQLWNNRGDGPGDPRGATEAPAGAPDAQAPPEHQEAGLGEVRQAARPWASSTSQKQGPIASAGGRQVEEDRDEATSGSPHPATSSTAPLPALAPAAASAASPPVAHPAESQPPGPPGPLGPPAPAATPPMAHPAESQEWPTIAHPAEAEAAPQQQPPPPQPPPQQHQQQQQQPQQQQPQQQQQQPQPQGSSQVAHPAEGSAVSEEPQSGG